MGGGRFQSKGGVQDGSIEAGLMMLELTDPRREWTPEDIAAACGCTSRNIRAIERRAMKKLLPAFRNRLTVKEIMAIEVISELDEPIWGVITHDRVLANAVTHQRAVEVIEAAGSGLANEATIVTVDVIARALKARNNGRENEQRNS